MQIVNFVKSCKKNPHLYRWGQTRIDDYLAGVLWVFSTQTALSGGILKAFNIHILLCIAAFVVIAVFMLYPYTFSDPI